MWVIICVMLFPSLSKSRKERFLWYGAWTSLGLYWVMKDGGESFAVDLFCCQRREREAGCVNECAGETEVSMPYACVRLCVCVCKPKVWVFTELNTLSPLVSNWRFGVCYGAHLAYIPSITLCVRQPGVLLGSAFRSHLTWQGIKQTPSILAFVGEW